MNNYFIAWTTLDLNNINKAIQDIFVNDELDTFVEVKGGITVIEIFEDIEKQTRPLAIIQDKILKSKITLNEESPWSICLEIY